MLEKPDLPDEDIITCLRAEYRLPVEQVDFLPLGADQNTAVYRAKTADEIAYFVKLRRGVFEETSVLLPKYLSEQGIEHILAPLPTSAGRLWADLASFKLILYPFVMGQDGYAARLSKRGWRRLGAAFKKLHTLVLPQEISTPIQQENFSPQWRDIVLSFLQRIGNSSYTEPVAIEVADFLRARSSETIDLVQRAGQLAQALQAQSPPFVLCHADMHAGNLLITPEQSLYIVDWDNPLLAPKERDLMSIGAGLMGGWRTPQVEEELFYQGYGLAQVDPIALAYYRYERIIQDIAVYCQQLLLSDAGGDDRAQSLHYLKSNFLPGGTIEIACKADRTGAAC